LDVGKDMEFSIQTTALHLHGYYFYCIPGALKSLKSGGGSLICVEMTKE
jgi:hypothetical protein